MASIDPNGLDVEFCSLLSVAKTFVGMLPGGGWFEWRTAAKDEAPRSAYGFKSTTEQLMMLWPVLADCLGREQLATPTKIAEFGTALSRFQEEGSRELHWERGGDRDALETDARTLNELIHLLRDNRNRRVWRAINDLPDEVVTSAERRGAATSPSSRPSLTGWVDIARLMEHFELPEGRRGALRKRLERFRQKHPGDRRRWREDASPNPNVDRFVYAAEMIAPDVAEWMRKSSRKRPARGR